MYQYWTLVEDEAGEAIEMLQRQAPLSALRISLRRQTSVDE